MTQITLDNINTLLEEGQITEAKSACDTFARENPNSKLFWHTYAMLDARLGHFQEALAHIQKAHDIAPDEPVLWNTEGNIWLRLQNTDKAITAYEKALSIDPKYAPAYNNLGNCYLKQEHMDKAEKAYLQAIRNKPHFADAHFNYGRLLLAKGSLTSALHVLEHAHQLNPKHPAVLGQLGELYMLQHDFGNAVTCFIKRLQQQPNHPNTFHRLGLARLKQKEHETAIDALNKALSLGCNEPDCHYLLATCYLELGNLKEALLHYLQQLEVEADTDTYYNIGVILMAQEHHHDSLTYFKEAVRLDPEKIDAWLNMGAIALKTGKLHEAIEYYTTCVEMDPENQEYKHILSALTQNNTENSNPSLYVKNLFDHYAPFYDTHLTSHLKYDVPDTIARYLEDCLDSSQEHSLRIVDLGCGTGLMGESIRTWKKQLIGIDLSPEMIKAAETKHCYDELVIGDITESITPYKHIDLVVAADVFTYIGDLSEITKAVHESLKTDGLFVFTVEKGVKNPYQLQQTIRYTHHHHYIQSLADTFGFTVLTLDNVSLRRQKGKPVEGYMVIMKKV